jgi:hypothetical protein
MQTNPKTMINVYCDESCHLENDKQKSMALGAISCPITEIKEVNDRIREIKVRNGIPKHAELKWVKVSSSKEQFYIDLVNYFFDNDNLSFRGVVIPDKTILDHSSFHQTHDDWYYKMYFYLLEVIINPVNSYNLYLDIKDTLGGNKIKKLKDVLSNSKYDFNHLIINHIQLVRSHEIEILQLTDLFIGALTYLHRGLGENKAKMSIISKIREKTGYNLEKSTILAESKFNIFVWKPNENGNTTSRRN